MYIDKLIKKEIVTIIVLVLIVLMLFFGVSYAYFMVTDIGESNKVSVGDLEITFCDYESCNKEYTTYGQVIGTKKEDGKNVIDGLYPYKSIEDALNENPYVFTIKNTGSLKAYLTIKLTEENNYTPIYEYEKLTNKYSNNIKIGISNCNNKINRDNVTILTYGLLDENIILKDDLLQNDEEKTYCLWTFLDSDTPNEAQNTYFVANLDFNAEYKPK